MRRLVKITLGSQQLCQQDSAACSTAQGVVAHAGKLIIKQGILPQAANADSHTVLGIAVQLGLRTVRFLKVVQELLGM